MRPEWGVISPETVSDWMNFDRTDSAWRYQSSSKESMAAKQTEGVAYLWNLLASEGTALLADEVGMGKTFQAIGVAALLWKMKPDARVLVMAPNRDICYHWRRELETFIRVHFRAIDHNVKNCVDGGPVPAVKFCFKLDDLVSAVEGNADHLYLTTIHSLSGLLRGDSLDGGDPPAEKAAGIAENMRKRLKAALGPDGFDLIIIDEAHYLRNTDGGSQRVAAARALFGPDGDRLGSHSLLLTATPSHTRLTNVSSVFGYFTEVGTQPEGENQDDASVARFLLDKYALRRLRLMHGREGLYSKRHYRHEKGMPSDFTGRPDAEMFFALYQKRLVADLRKQKEGKSLMYGYLEGFESVGRQRADHGPSGDEAGNDDSGADDFSKARDTELLRELTGSYYQQFQAFPDHPKYGRLVDQCVPGDVLDGTYTAADRKHLVFVRRIPSVRELTQRINERYDELLIEMIVKALGLTIDSPAVDRWRRKEWSRDGFKELVGQPQDQGDEIDGDEQDGGVEPGMDDLGPLASRVAELFVVKKEKGGQTDAAKVRLRFVKPESVFSLFLDPGSDYLCAPYNHFYGSEAGRSNDYGNAARYTRFQGWGSAADLKAAVGGSGVPDAEFSGPIATVWSLVVPRLSDGQRGKLAGWAREQRDVAENFANYLKAGLLYASPVIVELYCWFSEFHRDRHDRDAQRNYRDFMTWVEGRIEESLLLRYFSEALDSFESLCGKIIDHGLHDWQKEWTSLKRLTSPAWFASGENSHGRQRLILGFNSPFYPNVLVSTSVFQEGVNLHMQCHQVHHYGLAGSPGDNEQRVGRIDRLFGCVNRRLGLSGKHELSIYYPFLSRSVDEDQVASFIQRKAHVEDQMDACMQSGYDKDVKLMPSGEWEHFLRQPLPRMEAPVQDPYPARFDRFSGLPGYQHQIAHDHGEIRTHVESLFRAAIEADKETFSVVDLVEQPGSRTLFLIDPLVGQSGGVFRRQPVFVNLVFSPEFSALVPETAYVLSMVSPIASKAVMAQHYETIDSIGAMLGLLSEQLADKFPLARLAVNESADNTYFYLQAVVNLPVFVKQGCLESLSLDEVRMALLDLKYFADGVELALFNGDRDLLLDDVDGGPDERAMVSSPLKVTKAARDRVDWQQGEGVHGRAVFLEAKTCGRADERICRDVSPDGKAQSPHIRALELNHWFPFVKFSRAGEVLRVRLAYPAGDVQPEEETLLARWFQYVVSMFDEHV